MNEEKVEGERGGGYAKFSHKYELKKKKKAENSNNEKNSHIINNEKNQLIS